MLRNMKKPTIDLVLAVVISLIKEVEMVAYNLEDSIRTLMITLMEPLVKIPLMEHLNVSHILPSHFLVELFIQDNG